MGKAEAAALEATARRSLYSQAAVPEVIFTPEPGTQEQKAQPCASKTGHMELSISGGQGLLLPMHALLQRARPDPLGPTPPPSKRTPALYLWMREAEGGVAAAALHQEEGAEKEMRQTNEQHHQGPTEEDEGQESWNLTRGAERGPGEARQGYPNAVR